MQTDKLSIPIGKQREANVKHLAEEQPQCCSTVGVWFQDLRLICNKCPWMGICFLSVVRSPPVLGVPGSL